MATVRPFFRCYCGKLHASVLVSQTTTCDCGQNLWDVLMWVNHHPNVTSHK